MADYRVTNYCPQFENLKTKKTSVTDEVRRVYPRAIDMHTYIRNNDLPYKVLFIKAYNYKCAYCGTSLDIICKEMFEIDHFIYEKSFSTKAKAGYIENLVLACHTCNHRKSSLPIPTDRRTLLYPDDEGFRSVFVRDANYYIRINEEYAKDTTVKAFYEQLGLEDEIRRLDFLLMNMIGFQRKLTNNPVLYTKFGQAIDQLRRKRNTV